MTIPQQQAEHLANQIYQQAVPVLHIHGIGGARWRRNVPATDSRYGPWLQAQYTVLDAKTWADRTPCLYLAAGTKDRLIRYAGISRNGMRHRWRESPAIDHLTGKTIANQLFHSQCWRAIERELHASGVSEYEVRCINGLQLGAAVSKLGPPLSAFAALGTDAEGIAASVERWMCNYRSPTLVSWNISMTGKRR